MQKFSDDRKLIGTLEGLPLFDNPISEEAMIESGRAILLKNGFTTEEVNSFHKDDFIGAYADNEFLECRAKTKIGENIEVYAYIGESYDDAVAREANAEMREGLFWLICSMSADGIDWSEDWELYHLYAPSDSISHKDAWRQIVQRDEKRFRRYDYNYYPRGRVVVRNGKATIFLNRHIAVDEVVAAVNQTFGLTAPKLHAEGGEHYKCYIDRN